MCVETTNRHLESQFGLTITFFPVLVLLPSRVRILGWMGPLGMWPYSHSKVWWAAQWSVCRAGGAAGPHWPHSPMLHGYRGLYGSPRTAWWTAPTWVVTRGGRAASHAVAHLAVGDAEYIWLTRQWGTCVYFLKNVQTAETLLKAYTYKQHECDYHIPTVYMVLGLPGSGRVHYHNTHLLLPWHFLSHTSKIALYTCSATWWFSHSFIFTWFHIVYNKINASLTFS